MYIREEQARECLISSYDRGLMAKNDKKKSCALQHNSTLWQYRLWSFQGRDTELKRFLARN